MPRSADVHVVNLPHKLGKEGNLLTVDILVEVIRQFRHNAQIRALAEDIVRHCSERDIICELKSVYQWVRRNIRFLSNPRKAERITAPTALLQIRQGDCVEQVALLGSLLESIGNKTRVVGIAGDRRFPDIITHVYLDVLARKRNDGMPVWIGLDTVYARRPGKRPPTVGITKYYTI